jgi:hypothetical protein
MLIFRKMTLEDMDLVYQSDVLRSLITVPPEGEKFAIVIDDDGCLKGGVSGYKDSGCNTLAVIQHIAVDNTSEEKLLLDGLLRSLVHILEREGVKYLVSGKGYNGIFEQLGFITYCDFNKLPLTSEANEYTRKTIEGSYFFCLDIEEFFKGSCC